LPNCAPPRRRSSVGQPRIEAINRSIPATHRSIAANGITPAELCVTAVRPARKTPNRNQQRPDRGTNVTTRTLKKKEEEVFEMKKFGFASAIATGFAAAMFGLAAPAQADIAHHDWVHDIQQQATVGTVTPVFGNGR
jgi:hypothetical protein